MPKKDCAGASVYLPSRSHRRKWFHNCIHFRGSGREITRHAAVDIFQTTCAKRQLLDIKQAQDRLCDKLFYVQLRKTAWMSANVTQSTLTILNYTEKECAFPVKGHKSNHKRAKALGPTALHMEGKTSDTQEDDNIGASESSTSA